MATVTELVTKFSFVGSLNPLKNFRSGLAGATIGTAKMAAGLAVAAGSALAFGNAIAQSLKPLNVLSKQSGVTVGNIQKLEFAALSTGANIGSLEMALESLSQQVNQTALTGQGTLVERLGLGAEDLENSETALFGAIRAMNDMGFDRRQRLAIAEELGLDASLIGLLESSNHELQRMSKIADDIGFITPEQSKAVEEYTNLTATLGLSFKRLGEQLGVSLLPALNETAESMFSIVRSVAPALKRAFGVISFGIVTATDFIKDHIGFLTVLGGTLLAVTAGPILLAAALALIPVALKAILIAPFLLVLQDLHVAFNDGKSVIGDWVEKMTGIDLTKAGSAIKDLAGDIRNILGDAFDYVIEKIEGLFGWIGKLGKIIGEDLAESRISDLQSTGQLPTGNEEFLTYRARKALESRNSGGGSNTTNNVTVEVNTNKESVADAAVGGVYKRYGSGTLEAEQNRRSGR